MGVWLVPIDTIHVFINGFSFGLLFRKTFHSNQNKNCHFFNFHMEFRSDRKTFENAQLIYSRSNIASINLINNWLFTLLFVFLVHFFGVFNDVWMRLFSQNANANVLRFHHLPLQVFIYDLFLREFDFSEWNAVLPITFAAEMFLQSHTMTCVRSEFISSFFFLSSLLSYNKCSNIRKKKTVFFF